MKLLYSSPEYSILIGQLYYFYLVIFCIYSSYSYTHYEVDSAVGLLSKTHLMGCD